MNNITTRIAVTIAAASMAFAPIAAQAGTRAGDNQTVYSTSAAQPGVGLDADGERSGGGAGGLGIVIAITSLAAIIAALVIAADDNQTGGGN